MAAWCKPLETQRQATQADPLRALLRHRTRRRSTWRDRGSHNKDSWMIVGLRYEPGMGAPVHSEGVRALQAELRSQLRRGLQTSRAVAKDG